MRKYVNEQVSDNRVLWTFVQIVYYKNFKNISTGHGSSVGSMSALYAKMDPCVRDILSWKFFSLFH